LAKKGRQFISLLRTHYREQGSLEEGDFFPHVVKSEAGTVNNFLNK